MRTPIALLPSMDASDDEAFANPNAVIVLDGTSAFSVRASAYIAGYDEEQRADLLDACQRWEAGTDPHGTDLPFETP